MSSLGSAAQPFLVCMVAGRMLASSLACTFVLQRFLQLAPLRSMEYGLEMVANVSNMHDSNPKLTEFDLFPKYLPYMADKVRFHMWLPAISQTDLASSLLTSGWYKISLTKSCFCDANPARSFYIDFVDDKRPAGFASQTQDFVLTFLFCGASLAS